MEDMNVVVVFNLSQDEDRSYSSVYDVLEKKFHLRKFEEQGDRKVLTPTTTVIGNNDDYDDAKKLAQAIIDELENHDIVLDRIVVSCTDNYVLIG